MVNAAIGFKPLYALLKVLAKRVLEGTAEKNGVAWKQTVRELSAAPEVSVRIPLDQVWPSGFKISGDSTWRYS